MFAICFEVAFHCIRKRDGPLSLGLSNPEESEQHFRPNQILQVVYINYSTFIFIPRSLRKILLGTYIKNRKEKSKTKKRAVQTSNAQLPD